MQQNISFTDTEKLLLISAAYLRKKVTACKDKFHPTVQIINLALHWKGFSPDEINSGWNDVEKLPASHLAFFNALADRVFQTTRSGELRPPLKKDGGALLIGKGNWGVPGDSKNPPADPMFTQIQISYLGLKMVKKILRDEPKLAPLMETELQEPVQEETKSFSLSGNCCQYLELHLYTGDLAAGTILNKFNRLKKRAIAEKKEGKLDCEITVKLQNDVNQLKFVTTSYPCIYTSSWMDWNSSGSFFVNFFKDLNLTNYHYFLCGTSVQSYAS
jgi:hypothetical protein